MTELWPWFTVLFLAVFMTGLAFMWFTSRLESIRILQQNHTQLLLAMTALLEHHQAQLQKLTGHDDTTK